MSVPLPTPEGPHNTTICELEGGGDGGVIDSALWARCNIEQTNVKALMATQITFFLRSPVLIQ